MPKTFTAPFAQEPRTNNCIASTGFALTGAGSLVDNAPANTVLLLTAGIDGALVTSVHAVPRATCTGVQATLFIRKSGEPAGARVILDSVTVPGQTVSATTGIVRTLFAFASDASPYRMQAGDELYFGLGSTQAGGIVAQATFTNF